MGKKNFANRQKRFLRYIFATYNFNKIKITKNTIILIKQDFIKKKP